MSRFYSYINTASTLVNNYKAEMPFAAYLKQFFAAEKKYGSKDRKHISSLCYAYFRIASALKTNNQELAFQVAIFLCEQKSNQILAFVNPELNEQISLTLIQKLEIISEHIDNQNIFPLYKHLSESIKVNEFAQSMLEQPDLFIRLRPGKEKHVLQVIDKQNIKYKLLNDNSLSLINSTKIPEELEINTDYVVQDYSSQRVGEIIASNIQDVNYETSVWDCCAASGGKSIMMYDMGWRADLYVSDIRESILYNLKQRFKQAGLTKYHSFVADLTNTKIQVPRNNFNIIMADVPCTGSGTWSRTPEQLVYFKENEIEKYADRQKNIVSNIISYLKENGILVYITCSVFKEENEEITEFIESKGFNKIIEKQLIGYHERADSMYISILKKNYM